MTHNNIEFNLYFAVPTTTDATTEDLALVDWSGSPSPSPDSTPTALPSPGDSQPAVAAATSGIFG